MSDIYDPNARHHESNKIHETAIIHDCVTLGKGNIVGPYTVIGGNGEIRGQSPELFKGTVVIGDNNVISELVTIQRPLDEGEKTVIGNDNLIMAHSHIGHDVKIGNGCEICTGTILGGYVEIADGAKIKLGVTVRNRKKVGKNALAGMGSVIVKDVLDQETVVGNPAKPIK